MLKKNVCSGWGEAGGQENEITDITAISDRRFLLISDRELA